LPALTQVINARGTFTPLGVSRSSPAVCEAVAAALREHVVMAELEAAAEAALQRWSGAEAATVVHCTAAAITLAVAAAIAGCDPRRIASLPDATGVRRDVVLPAPHAVDYGHPLVQDLRLAGARAVMAGDADGCDPTALAAALDGDGVACLLLVSSRLVKGHAPDLCSAVAAAHARGIPAVIDGAAQDFRVAELLATGADLVLISAQKYLAGPTAGLVLGSAALVGAVKAQQRGIGRAMKPTKEALAGVIAAVEERAALAPEDWWQAQRQKTRSFVARLGRLPGVVAASLPDPTGLPFERAILHVTGTDASGRATALADALRAGTPSIWVMDHAATAGEIGFELVPLRSEEMEAILQRLEVLLLASKV
jgi:L-seryl-tRNA(Ser) seleniumtransferase